jgi:hypothetical protein
MKCRQHAWGINGIRMLKKTIRRGQQEANAEMYRQCGRCGKTERTGLLNVRPQSVGTPQTTS